MEQVESQSESTSRREFLRALAAGGALAVGSRWSAAQAAQPPSTAAEETTISALAKVFANPPASASPGAYWYWLGGNVTREGITADLEAMRDVGISQPMLFSIGGANGKDALVQPPAVALTDTWWVLVEHAALEAERLGLTLALNFCDGWATASGPWITPELSMQQLTWSSLSLDGGKRFTNALPSPPAKRDYYRDIATVAFPLAPGWEDTSFTRQAKISTNLPLKISDAARLGDPSHEAEVVETEQAGWIEYAFDKPFTLRSITVHTPSPYGFSPGVYRAANSLEVQASDDGNVFRRIGALEYPKHGWQTDLTTLTHAVPQTTARFFRLVHTPLVSGEYREEYDFGQDVRLRFFSIVLSGEPRVHHLQGKSGAQSILSRSTSEQDVPASACVQLKDIVDLTSKVGADGALTWDVPPGRWRVLRIGYTTSGAQNSAAGGAQGLECDRFNPEATRLQFDNWFGKALQRVGPRLAGKILHVLHVDSWEAGSQNWSPAFCEGFRALRGYDLLPYIATMTGMPITSASESERVLLDVRRTINDLTQRHFFAKVQELAHARGCIFSAEPASPTYPVDGLEHVAHVDLPMGEFWLNTPRNDKPTDIKDAVSGARIYGKPVIGAEAFTQGLMKWDEHPYKLKPLGDRMFCEGINRFMLHVYAQQPWVDRAPGMTLNGIGTFFSRTQTWWKPGKAWFDYLRRSQALLQQGVAVADVAYFIGENIPSRAFLPRQLSVPLPRGYAYDSINRDALLNLCSVDNGGIVLKSGARYRVLVLPNDPIRTPEMTARLRELANAGAVIVEPGAPLKIDVRPDFEVAGAQDIQWIHRRGDEWDLYFLSNPSMDSLNIEAKFRVRGRTPEIWYPDTGKTAAPAQWREQEGRTQVSLSLDPNGSLFVVFSRSRRRSTAVQRQELAAVEVPGGWRVQFPNKAAMFDVLTSWSEQSDPDIQYFSGTATYAKTFALDRKRNRRLLLDLGQVHDLVQVVLNGKDLGVLWKPPFTVEITQAARAGENKLELRVTNTWRNRLIGDRGKAGGDRNTFVVPMLRKGKPWLPGETAGDELSAAGLLGPVRVRVTS
jgi:hypothetical protein